VVIAEMSFILHFYWSQPVFYKPDDASFSSELVKFLVSFGHHMTVKILADNIKRVIYILAVSRADDRMQPNLPLTDFLDGEDLPRFS